METFQRKLELVYLPKGKYCVYPRLVYRLAIVMPPPPPSHFGWPKMNVDRISRHFRSIRNTFYFFFTKWLHENEFRFRSHFSPFQINTQLLFLFCWQNGCRRPFWMTENHFRSHFSPFQINAQLFFYLFLQNGCRRPFWTTENHFWFLFCWQNGCRRPFWMTENHFRSHFSPFQINTQLFVFNLFTNSCRRPFWMAAGRKSFSIAFLAISDQCATFFLFVFTKWLPAAILDDRKSLLIAFLAISDQYTICFHKMAASGHFEWPKIIFDRISRHFRSIRNFDLKKYFFYFFLFFYYSVPMKQYIPVHTISTHTNIVLLMHCIMNI